MKDELNIQWYPGHMTKTRRMMEEDLKLVDAVCELLDARIPMSSRNPDIAALCGNKPRMVILNRSDLADPKITAQWAAWFKSQGLTVIQRFFLAVQVQTMIIRIEAQIFISMVQYLKDILRHLHAGLICGHFHIQHKTLVFI